MRTALVTLVLMSEFLICAQQVDSIPSYETFKIDSKQLGELRTINVWTPSGYSEMHDSLPVMYMPDGGILEDFPHVANTFAELIKNKKIPPVILVGIENTQRRRDLTGPTAIESDKQIAPVVGGSEKFRDFISKELIPEITARYRVTNESGIIGESLAGLFIVETLLLKPDLFDLYIALDPSLWWNDHYLVRNAKTQLSKFTTAQKRLWFASSKTKNIATYTKELAAILTSENLPNLKWTYAHEPKEKHHTIYRATKAKALLWIFSDH